MDCCVLVNPMTITRNGKKVITCDVYGHVIKTSKTRIAWNILKTILFVALAVVISATLVDEIVQVLLSETPEAIANNSANAFLMLLFGVGGLVVAVR